MSLRGKRVSGLLWLIIFSPALLAVETSDRLDFHPVFRSISTGDGLPDPGVEAIIQDRHGYVWIGTQGGLLRHEGDQLRLLPRHPQTPGALPSNNIMALHAHSNGTIWAAVSGAGVVEIGPDLAIRRHLTLESEGGLLPHDPVWSMAEDCDGNLWLAFMRGGVARFSLAGETLEYFPQNEDSGLSPNGFQLQVKVDSACQVWVVQTERLSRLDPSASGRRFETVLERGADRWDLMMHVFEHSRHGLLAIRGFEVLRASAGSADAEPAVVQTLHRPDGVGTSLGELPDGRLLLIQANAVSLLDLDQQSMETIRSRPDLIDGLPSGRLIGSHLIDTEGGIWIALSGNGLVYLPPEHAAFSRVELPPGPAGSMQRITAVSEMTADGEVWVGSDEMDYRLDLQTGEVSRSIDWFPDWSRVGLQRRIRGLLASARNLVVLESRSLLLLQQPPESLRTIIAHENEHTGDYFQFMSPALDGGVWVGGDDQGMLRVWPELGQWQRYGPAEPGRFALPESSPRDFVAHADHGEWLAGERTLYRYDSVKGFRPMAECEQGPISALAISESGLLWTVSPGGLSSRRITAQSLSEPTVHDVASVTERADIIGLLAESEQRVWLILSNGLASFDPTNGRVRSYTRADGLATAEFSPRAIRLLPDGRLLLGGSRGLVLVTPDRLQPATPAPPVHLTRVVAGNYERLLVPGQREPVSLSWRQNSVRFDFTALSYSAPEQLNYRVRLAGWDEDWLLLRRQNQMYYSNLRPGRYEFEVQVSSRDGDWGTSADRLLIEIARPLWASNLALTGYLLLLLAVGGLGWQSLHRARRRHAELREIDRRRRLAEGQRQLIERLNVSLDPLPLARAIAAEILRLTAARDACFGYVHELMPRDLVTALDTNPPTRESWQASLASADGCKEQAVDLVADRAVVARVLLTAPSGGFAPDHEQRLALLLDLAGQSLHNSVLLQRVKRLAERADQANRAKSEFLATMSHEIRTPLHGVMGMADLLYETQTDPRQQDLIDTLRTSGGQLQRIIDDVLDLSRIEAGRLRLDQQPFELVSLLEHVIDLHAPTAARKHLDLRLRFASDLPMLVHGDPDRLNQVLGNLLSNALKFTEQGAVELAVRTDTTERLVFSVSDSGPGIPESLRGDLFRPFSQLDSSIRRSHGGSGLGLAICRRLSDAMGGQISLVGQRWPGSRFELSLPVGRWRPPGRPTRLLAGLRLAALVDAPTYRVLLRLARRWGFSLLNAKNCPPACGALLLVDVREELDESLLKTWVDACPHGWRLESPYSSEPSSPSLTAYHFLRWPLVESRLVGALLDHVLKR